MKRLLRALLAVAFIAQTSATCSAPIRVVVGTNPDGVKDTAHDCVDGVTNCRGPAPATRAWDVAALAAAMSPLVSQQTGNATAKDLSAYCLGTGCATSIYALHNAVTNWSIATVSVLTNTGVSTGDSGTSGALVLDVCASAGVGCVTSASFNWAYVSPPVSDTTPPTFAAGIAADSVGSLSVTLSVDMVMDPKKSVTWSGVSNLRFYRNGTFVDSLATPSSGLVCDLTGMAIGTVGGTPSATQGSGASGAQWTIAGHGQGVDGAADSYYGVFCPVSGNSVYVIDRVDTLPTVLTYNKAHSDIRNVGTAGTEAHYDCVLMLHGGAYYMQRTRRATNGGSNSSTNEVALPITLPFYRRNGVVNNVGECDYSAAGGPWISVFSGDAITLNDSKIAGVGPSTTSTGSDTSDITSISGSVAVETVGRLTKTLTVPAGAATYTVRPKDVAGNETAAVGSVAATATSGGPLPTAIGWHPGDSVSNWRDSGHLNNQVTRFGEYDQTQFAANCNIKGAHYLAPWAQLEGPTHGSYASGFALIHAEINHLKALSCPKWLILQVFDELNYSITQSMSGQASYYPAYLNTAGCLAQGVEGGGGGGGVITHVADWNPTCRSYVLDLIAAYGAEFNGEPYFEAFAYPYERIVQTCCQLNGYSAAAYDSATRVIAQAMRTAFPNKIVFMTLNWYTGDATQFSSLVAYLASIGVGWGPGDMIYVAGASSPTFYYQTIDKLTVGALGGPDYRGVVPLMWRYEATELGYTGNGDSQRGFTGAEIYNYVNNSIHANYLINERNIFIGGNASRWYNCDPDGVYNRACSQTSNPGGLLIRINTPTPLTHLACPTNFDTLFGNGSAGSGCNTGY